MAGRRERGRDLAAVAERFARWRQSRVRGERIPDSLWTQAVELAVLHGVSRTACALKVGYYDLQKRTARRSPSGTQAERPTGFVELPPVAAGECLIEFEKACGLRMRVHIKGSPLPDLAALGRTFWDAKD